MPHDLEYCGLWRANHRLTSKHLLSLISSWVIVRFIGISKYSGSSGSYSSFSPSSYYFFASSCVLLLGRFSLSSRGVSTSAKSAFLMVDFTIFIGFFLTFGTLRLNIFVKSSNSGCFTSSFCFFFALISLALRNITSRYSLMNA